jgi:hypothetical protein
MTSRPRVPVPPVTRMGEVCMIAPPFKGASSNSCVVDAPRAKM